MNSKPRGFIPYVHDLYKKARRENELNFKERLKEAIRIGLLKAAMGLEYEEIKTIYLFNNNGQPYLSSIKKSNKVVLPNTQACIFLLKMD